MVRWNRRNGVPYSDGSLSLFFFLSSFLCGTRVDSIFKIHRKLPGRIQRTFSSFFILTGLLPVIFQLNAEPYVRKRLGRRSGKKQHLFLPVVMNVKNGAVAAIQRTFLILVPSKPHHHHHHTQGSLSMV